jgi:hypothetical protein
MTRISGRGSSSAGASGYFIRRTGDDCAVIALHGEREEVMADGLSLGDAEDLCVSRIDALRTAPATASAACGELQPRRDPPRIKKHGGRQLAFKF